MSALAGVKVGDKLFCVEKRRGKPTEREVTKIGRKWIVTGEGRNALRWDPETGDIELKQYNVSATAYRSEAEYKAAKDRDKAWLYLRSVASPLSPPAHLSTDEIRAMAARIRGDAP